MKRWLVLFEDGAWSSLRPLTDLVTVPALAFGGSTLGARWERASGLPLLRLETRPIGPASGGAGAEGAAAGDEAVVVNAAALHGPWFAQVTDSAASALWLSGERVVAARLPISVLRTLAGKGEAFAAALRELGLASHAVEARCVTYPWDLIAWNVEALDHDLAGDRLERRGDVHRLAALENANAIEVAAGARVEAFAVLDARGGPIAVRAGARIAAHTLVEGPCVVGERSELLGGRIARSTIGPECRIAGEVEDSVWQGYANKRHHGFIGHSAISEWVNLGALTTTSDLKNNYSGVRAWIGDAEIETGQTKLGSLIGAHVKTGIGTLLPTGASVGTGSNLFGGGRFAPRRAPAFAWWDGERMAEHRFEKFLASARIAMSRRQRTLGAADEALLRALFEATAAERRS